MRKRRGRLHSEWLFFFFFFVGVYCITDLPEVVVETIIELQISRDLLDTRMFEKRCSFFRQLAMQATPTHFAHLPSSAPGEGLQDGLGGS